MPDSSHTLVLGGAKSGKSAFALSMGQRIISAQGGSVSPARGLFVATAQARDAEMEERIRRHREERGPEWETVEEPVDITGLLRGDHAPYSVILIDCLTLWLANIMYEYPDDIEERCADLCVVLQQVGIPVIMVSNEVGMGIVPVSVEARRFRDYAGRLHQAVARVCSRVIFTVAGLPMFVKGENNA